MTGASLFEVVADQLEQRSGLNRLQARGVVRLALKDAGLDAGSVTRAQMEVVVARRLAVVLQRNGIGADKAPSICAAIQGTLAAAADNRSGSDSPEALFDRLDNGRR